jgi:hypothetical protein
VAERDVFWGEIAPSEHIVHLYRDERAFMDLLTSYVGTGLSAYESVIVVATAAHLETLNQRLTQSGLDLAALRANERYFDLDAKEALAQFMEGNWPSEERFVQFVSGILQRAGRDGRRIRAFGEMVAVLWEQGHAGATVRLEHLWNEFRARTPFPLYCAYPRTGFTQLSAESLREICAAHTKIISNRPLSMSEA